MDNVTGLRFARQSALSRPRQAGPQARHAISALENRGEDALASIDATQPGRNAELNGTLRVSLRIPPEALPRS